MRKLWLILPLCGIVLMGCDDSHETEAPCDKACGHGSCYVQVTQEACMCDDGYLKDADGTCTIAKAPELKVVSKPQVKNNVVTFDVQLIDGAGVAQSPKIVITRNGGELVVLRGRRTVKKSDNIGTTKKASYTISLTSNNGVEVDPLFIPVWNEETKFDWRDGVLYFAFIDRFNNGNPANDNKLNIQYDWYGGDFAGLKAKVESNYFTDLGVNVLWISSISMNTQKAAGKSCGYHSYWPITTGYSDKTASMFEGASSNGVPITPIEPHFGTLEELKELVKACHDRGIRVLVDFAANHVADDSPVFLQHPEWFNYSDYQDRDSILCEGPTENGELSQKNWDRIPETCWFSDNLPDFNYEIPEVRQFTLEHARWLIRTTDIDGFRLDAVKHMPIQFIKELRSGIDEMFTGSDEIFYIVGETFDGEWKIKQYIGDDMLHGQFDFPLYNTLRGTIMNGDGKFWDLKDFVPNNDRTYGNALMSTFLGNHDVARAISHIHHDSELKYHENPEVTDTWAYRQLRLAWVFLLTSPMLPMIYYGDEYGLEGANDPDNRRMMEFDNQLNDEQRKTIELVRKLGTLRHKHPALWRGTRQNIDAYARAYTYLMKGENETILVGICDADEDQTFNVPEGSKGWIDLLDESNTITDTTSVTLNYNRQIIVWKLKD